MGIKGFLERPEGVGFWTMMLLSLAFVLYSYLIIQTVDWLLVFVLIIAGGIFRVLRLHKVPEFLRGYIGLSC